MDTMMIKRSDVAERITELQSEKLKKTAASGEPDAVRLLHELRKEELYNIYIDNMDDDEYPIQTVAY